MKHIKNWLLPVLTGLTVLACALLPRHLSQIQDRKIFHVIHAEAMSADSSLPVWSPELLQKIHLLASWLVKEPLIIIHRDLNEAESTPEELRTMKELVLSELDFFIQENLLPKSISINDFTEIHGNRIYLQDSEDSAGNWFLQAEVYDSEEFGLWMILDEETGKTLQLHFFCLSPIPLSFSVQDAGTGFLDHLDIEYELSVNTDNGLVLPLKDQCLQYCATVQGDSFQIEPEIDFSRLDADMRDAYGISADKTNSSMQIYDK